jgi:hypothetical protein
MNSSNNSKCNNLNDLEKVFQKNMEAVKKQLKHEEQKEAELKATDTPDDQSGNAADDEDSTEEDLPEIKSIGQALAYLKDKTKIEDDDKLLSGATAIASIFALFD